MKYLVFLTKNKRDLVNGQQRIYVGVHPQEDPEFFDGYLGDGVYTQQANTFMFPRSPFQCAVKQYGCDSFQRLVLYVYDTIEKAYAQERLLVNDLFCGQDFTYNMFSGSDVEDRLMPLYQFDMEGNLEKTWEQAWQCHDFFSYPRERFLCSIKNRNRFLGSYWSFEPTFDPKDGNDRNPNNVTYLFNKGGKCLRMFGTAEECAGFIGSDVETLKLAVRDNKPVLDEYFVSHKVFDKFHYKPRRALMREDYYVYIEEGNCLGKYHGKEVMKVIDMHSWKKLGIIMDNGGWYKNFFISFEKVDQLPDREKGPSIDVYTQFGEFIEHVESFKEIRERYGMPASILKDIQQGKRHFGDYVFKYSK